MRTRRASTVLIYVSLGVMALVFLYPVVLMVLTAFKSTPEIFRNPFGLPETWSLDSFRNVWKRANFGIYLRNSVLITGASAAQLLATAAPAAYALARYTFRLRGVLFIFFLAGLQSIPRSVIEARLRCGAANMSGGPAPPRSRAELRPANNLRAPALDEVSSLAEPYSNAKRHAVR